MDDRTMSCDTVDPQVVETPGLVSEVDSLAAFIEERFPSEAANADMTDRAEVVFLAKQLLERLWRWEH
jgi:hypothetical protein